MVVKDEEQLLGRCLDSVKGIVDEIIIIDTGSSDKTLEIAKRYTSKAHSYNCKRDAAGAGCEARNESLKYATKDWILVIDADEIFEIGLVDELKKAIEEPDAVAYTIIQRNYTHNVGAAGFIPSNKFNFPGYYDNRITRLFRREKGILFSSDVHEQVDPSILRMGKKITDSKVVLHHLRELKKVEREKQLNYLRLYEKKVMEEPDDVDTLLGLAIIYQNQLHDHEKAISYFKRVLELSPKKIEALINLSYLYIESNNLESAKQVLDKALGYYPQNASLLNNYTVYYIKTRNFEKAKETVENVLKIEENNINALMNKGFLYVNSREYSEALACFDKIIENTPFFLEARLNKALILFRKEDYQKAKAELDKILEISPNFEPAKKLLKRLDSL